MKWFLIILAVLTGLIAAMFIAGSMLSQQHTASSSATFTSTPEVVWAVVTSRKDSPSWRDDLREVIETGDQTFKEVTRDGEAVEYRIEESTPSQKLVIRIITPDLPYGGSWTYDFTPSGGGCTLIITENGEVYNPIFRFISRYLIGHTSTIDTYLKNLKTKVV